MNENYNNQCQKQGDQNYEIGCGCSGILQYFNSFVVQKTSAETHTQPSFFANSHMTIPAVTDTFNECFVPN